jgi:hypothetical protein
MKALPRRGWEESPNLREDEASNGRHGEHTSASHAGKARQADPSNTRPLRIQDLSQAHYEQNR